MSDSPTELDSVLCCRKKQDFWILGTIIIATAALYTTTINGPFIYDDLVQILDNDKIHNLFNFKDIFLYAGRTTRPLLNFLYALCWSIAPAQTWPFHLVLIIAHLINTTLVFKLVRKLFPQSRNNRQVIVFVSTVLFAFHPLQVQGVSYILGGLSSIQCLFYLSCLNLYDSKDSKNDWKIRILLAVSMLCKESCLLIPAVLVWWDLSMGGLPFKSLSIRRHGAFILSSLSVMTPLYFFVSNPATSYSDSTGFRLYPYGQYLLTQAHYYVFYLRLLVDSSMQSVIHAYPSFDTAVLIEGIAGSFICLTIIFLAFMWGRKKPIFSFLVGFFFLSLLLTNTFLEMSNPFAEYRFYQANLSAFVAFGYLMGRLFQFVKRPALKLFALFTPIIWLIWSSYLMQTIWTNEALIYVYSLAVYPDSYELVQLLGAYYEHQSKYDQAEEQYLKALQIVEKFPGRMVYFHPYHLLFRVYAHSSQWDKALKELEIIERELGGGQLPIDGYRAYLQILKIKNNRPLFDKVRKKALGFYPIGDFPKWTDEIRKQEAIK